MDYLSKIHTTEQILEAVNGLNYPQSLEALEESLHSFNEYFAK